MANSVRLLLHYAVLPWILGLANASNAEKKLSAVLPLRAAAYGTSFDVDIVIGDQTFLLTADTGSSDLWVLQPDWKCYFGKATWSGTPVPREKCIYGNKTYSQSSSLSPIDSAWLGEHYGAGNVEGPLGYESVQIGGISIPRQTTGFVNASTAYGDGLGSGILGLGYPVIASRLLYDTVLVSMIKQGMEPYFAFALERTPLQQEIGFGGYLTFGTLPPVAHGQWITAPVEITKTIPLSFTNGTAQISEWTLTVQAVTWDGQTHSTPFQAVVDSGNWQNIFPEAIATKVNAKFDPPAGDLDRVSGYYPVKCDAIPPADLGVQIGGKTISINSKDMIWRDWSGQCYSSVGATIPYEGIALNFLGDVFLKNVVAVFDMGKDEMRFAQRIDGNSSNPVPASTGEASGFRLHWYTLSVVAALGAIVAA